jgi:glycolate oxidase
MGRMPCFGLAAAGAAGCVRMLELMEDEIRIALALLGVDRLSALDPSYVHPAPAVARPHVFSAFPLLDGPEY